MEWSATQFLWTGRTVPSVSGERDKSSSKLWGKMISETYTNVLDGGGEPKPTKTTKKWCSCTWCFVISRL